MESRIIHFKEEFIREASARARVYEKEDHGCSDRVLATFMELLGIDSEMLIKAASSLTGGLGLQGQTCGALLGGAMALGLIYGRTDPSTGMDGLRNCQKVVYELVRKFKLEFGVTLCRDLTGRDFTLDGQAKEFMESGEFDRKCVEYAAKTAGWVAEIIHSEIIGLAEMQPRN